MHDDVKAAWAAAPAPPVPPCPSQQQPAGQPPAQAFSAGGGGNGAAGGRWVPHLLTSLVVRVSLAESLQALADLLLPPQMREGFMEGELLLE